MKNKVILLLVAVVVLSTIALVGCGQVPPSMSFIAPGQSQYYVGDTLNLTGGKVVVYDESTQNVDLTADMLDSTSYNMAVSGTYNVKGSYQDFDFSFAITVQALYMVMIMQLLVAFLL